MLELKALRFNDNGDDASLRARQLRGKRMLERISEIQGIGLLHEANGKMHTFKKATLIYADNGRGKSTLASTLRSVSTGDTSLISNRTTIDGTFPPKVILQFGSGHKVSFENDAWSEQRPEVVVFDADFVERNVHSGGTVNTAHRKNLLEFALGEAAVSTQFKLENATNAVKTADDEVKSIESKLSGYHAEITLAEFEKLPNQEDADTKISDLQKRIYAANDVTSILNKAVPAEIPLPKLDINGFFEQLAISLDDIHIDAERIVKEHIAKLGNSEAERWISDGRQFNDSETCPYCGQDSVDNDLFRAYRTHFNVAYSDLKIKVENLHRTVNAATDQSIVDNFTQSVTTVKVLALAWGDYVQTQQVTFDAVKSQSALGELQTLLIDLARKKQASPLEPTGNAEEKDLAFTLWEKVVAPMRDANTAIKASASNISTYKAKLSAENVHELQRQLLRLQAGKRRYEVIVVDLIDDLRKHRITAKEANAAKKEAGDNLKSIMESILQKYETSINELLGKFGASFRIKGMGGNLRGKGPRSEYGLSLRGKDVALEGGSPSFSTALSEGDKRTLAFAFFVASTLADLKLDKRIIVIDDPMCSLDLNRKHYTRAILKNIHMKAEQLIVLAHDPYFIRDFRDDLLKQDSSAYYSLIRLTLAPGDYTDFADFDVDKECESAYFQHHRLLNNFASGNGGDARSVAKAIRPMLEGYLHRRFPGLVPKTLMFGQVVSLIREAEHPSSLCHAQSMVDELNEVNDYAGKFHHDTNPDADTITIVNSELKIFVEQALLLVHRGA